MPEEEKSRRILQGEVVIYPFTKQENVIGLQKTITDKLPIVSSQQPTQGFVQKQAWFDTNDDSNENTEENYGNERRLASNEIIEYNYEDSQEESENYGSPNEIIEENYEGVN